MNTKLIELEDGVLIEVETIENEVTPISGGAAEKVKASLENIKPILIKICKPIVELWNELNKDMVIGHAEVELGLSFEGEGNIYVTKAKAAANYTIKLTLQPPNKKKIRKRVKK